MIDPILSLAFTIHSNKGVYALLLGSGVSRGAGIPTGWEVVLDLVKKLANLKETNTEEDPVTWYTEEFGEEPSYDRLLNDLAKSPAERANLLKPYFEPTAEDSDEGLRKPTKAHKAIAQLVKGGYIRVILTTNFDRLIENALHEVDITPTVISTADASEGALPLTHAPVTVIKLHGDYLDTRIKNTPEELEVYDERINALLDRILDEYGLIVCGWSADYDPALRAALERCKSHRFTAYWTQKDEPGIQANKLISLRRAEIVKINTADEFFLDLSEKVQSLEELSRPHPISIQAAVASVKRYLVDDRHKILLRDLVSSETEKVVANISDERRWPVNLNFDPTELVRRVERYKVVNETLISFMITGCHWGEKSQTYLWKDCIQQIANSKKRSEGNGYLVNLQRYPALLLIYAGGIASVAAGQYHNLFAVLEEPVLYDQGQRTKVYEKINLEDIFARDLAKQLPGFANRPTPESDYLWETLREFFREYLSGNDDYNETFDRFELLSGLVFVNNQLRKPGIKQNEIWVSRGRYMWRAKRLRNTSVIEELRSEAKAAGEKWEVLQAGFLGGSIQRFLQVSEVFENVIY